MRDNHFCPLINQSCKKDECIMWESESCFLRVFLISSILTLARLRFESEQDETNGDLVTELSTREDVALDKSVEQDSQSEKFNAIFSKSADEFADEIIKFSKDENLLKVNQSYLPREIEDIFWSSKGLEISTWKLPPQFRSIINKAWLIASAKLEKEARPTHIDNDRDKASDNREKAILSLPNEVISEQLLTFVKESGLGEGDSADLNIELLHMFWKSKGITDYYDASPEIGIKIKQVEKLARDTIQQQVFSSSTDELARELAEYAKRKAGKDSGQGVHASSMAYTFWHNKGLSYRVDSLELQERKDEVEQLAQEFIDKDFYEYMENRIKAEKSELPKLVHSCVEWARKTGSKSITLKDVKFFLLENQVDILEATQRALYLSANYELKAQK